MAGAISFLIIFLLLFQIGSITKGAHASETAVAQSKPSYTTILKQPVDAPYYTVRNSIRKIRPNTGIVITRGMSAVVGFVSIGLFYALVSLWYRPRVAILGTILYATSNWLLRNSRLGLPVIQQALVLALIFLPAWLKRTRHRQLAIFAAVAAVAYLLYVPGLIWFIMLGFIWRAKDLLQDVKSMANLTLVLLGIFLLIIVSPLMYSIFNDPLVLLRLAGIPEHISLSGIIHNFTSIPLRLFVRSDPNGIWSVGYMPILDVFTSMMVIVGTIDTWNTRKLDRSKITLGMLFLAFVLSCLGGNVLLTIMLPPIYLLVTAGISYMLNEWFRVFPKNPLARTSATIMITIAVLIAAAYQVTNYFIAWPNTASTKSAFSQRY